MIVPKGLGDFETYRKLAAGGDLGQGLVCDGCGSSRLHRHGCYERGPVVTADGEQELWIWRVLCVECGRAPSIVPAFAAIGLRADDRVAEEAVASYLGNPGGTYRAVASACRVTHVTVYRWVSRLGAVGVASLLALLVRLRPEVDPLAILPKVVPAEDRKARSTGRKDVLRTALQVLVASRRCGEELVRGVAGARPPTLRVALGGFPT